MVAIDTNHVTSIYCSKLFAGGRGGIQKYFVSLGRGVHRL